MTNSLEAELQKEMIQFCKSEEANKEPKPLGYSLTAELLRQITRNEREITGMATNEKTGDVFVRFSIKQATRNKTGQDEQGSPDPNEQGEQIIWCDDGVSLVHISVGFERSHYPLYKLTWNNDKGAEEVTGNGCWLTLNEIRDQIYKKHSGRTIIEVRVDNPLEGAIYQVGNYQDKTWRKHGTTRGYA